VVSVVWDEELAAAYDEVYAWEAEPSVVEPITEILADMTTARAEGQYTLDPDHVGIETFDDPVGQIAWSHHWMEVGGRLVRHSAPYRYVWPSELDLMARLAGFRRTHRWSDWGGTGGFRTVDNAPGMSALWTVTCARTGHPQDIPADTADAGTMGRSSP